MSSAAVTGSVAVVRAGSCDADALSRLHAGLFDAPWDAESFRQTLAHPGAIAVVAYAGARCAGKPHGLQGPSELTQGPRPNVPSPLRGGWRHVEDMPPAWAPGGGIADQRGLGSPPPLTPPRRGPGGREAFHPQWVGEAGAQLCGFIVGRLAADEAEILTLGVAPDWQRLGIGGRLVEALCCAAGTRGARHLYLEVAAGNAAARALYGGFGFQERGRRAGYYAHAGAPAEDAINLRLPLERPAPPGAIVDD